MTRRRAAFWFSVSVIASVILFYVWEWLRFEADMSPNEVTATPLLAGRIGCWENCDCYAEPITSFDLPAYRRAGLI